MEYRSRSVRLGDDVWAAIQAHEKSANQILREALGLNAVGYTPKIEAKIKKSVPRTGATPRRIVVKENPLPDDARVVRLRVKDQSFRTVQLVIESESFAEVLYPDNSMAPILPELPPVVFETQYDEASGSVQ